MDLLVRVSVRVAEGEGVKVNVGVNDGVGVVLGVAVGVLPIGSNGRNNKPVQKPYVFPELKPESMKSFEIGYKGLIAKNF